jgi:hypothetical protein
LPDPELATLPDSKLANVPHHEVATLTFIVFLCPWALDSRLDWLLDTVSVHNLYTYHVYVTVAQAGKVDRELDALAAKLVNTPIYKVILF